MMALSPPPPHSSPYLFTISSLSCWLRLGRPGDTLPMMGGAYTVLALVVVLLLTAAEFSFALYAFRSRPPKVSYLSLIFLALPCVLRFSLRDAHFSCIRHRSLSCIQSCGRNLTCTQAHTQTRTHTNKHTHTTHAVIFARRSRRASDITTCSKLCP